LSAERDETFKDKDGFARGGGIGSPGAIHQPPRHRPPFWKTFFSTSEMNMNTLDRTAARGSMPIGVDLRRGRYRARCRNPSTSRQEHLDTFPAPLFATLSIKLRN